MALKKEDIARKIADDCGFMKKEAVEILEKLLDIMKKSLISGERIMISGFGTWRVRSKRPRPGRNPWTGEHMVINARKSVTWNYSPVLKKVMNESGRGLRKQKQR